MFTNYNYKKLLTMIIGRIPYDINHETFKKLNITIDTINKKKSKKLNNKEIDDLNRLIRKINNSGIDDKFKETISRNLKLFLIYGNIDNINHNYIELNLTNAEITSLYGEIIKELKNRNIIRTKNICGDLGEFLVINYYNTHANLPKLQEAPIGTKNIDAISREGERYSIKATTTNTTGVFYGIEDRLQKKFEYVIICQLDESYSLKAIYELSWEKFFQLKHWHSRMKAWNIVISKKVIENSTAIYSSTI